MNENPPTVSVIIPPRAATTELPRAPASVAKQDYRGEVEVVVAAADEATAVIAERNGATVVRNGETGDSPAPPGSGADDHAPELGYRVPGLTSEPDLKASALCWNRWLPVLVNPLAVP